MSWAEAEKKLTSFQFVRLENDGDSEVFRFLSEPVTRESEYKGNKRTDFCFVVATVEGLKVLSVNKTTARHIYNRWDDLKGVTVQIVRHGKKGSTDTVYDVYDSVGDMPDVDACYENTSKDDVNRILESLQSSGDNSETRDDIPF